MYWGISIVLRIDEVCLIWLETVSAEFIDLLDPSFFKSRYFQFHAIDNLFQLFMTRKESTLKKMSREVNFKKVKMKGLEDLKIKIFWEFEVAKCFKRGEIFLNNALN